MTDTDQFIRATERARRRQLIDRTDALISGDEFNEAFAAELASRETYAAVADHLAHIVCPQPRNLIPFITELDSPTPFTVQRAAMTFRVIAYDSHNPTPFSLDDLRGEPDSNRKSLCLAALGFHAPWKQLDRRHRAVIALRYIVRAMMRRLASYETKTLARAT